MNRKTVLAFLLPALVVVSAVAGVLIWRAGQEPQVVEVGFPSGLRATTDPAKMMSLCDLTVVGTYLGEDPDGKPYPGEAHCPVACGMLAVDQVLKGSCEETISFYYYGGELYIKEAIEYAEREGADRKKKQIFEWLDKDDPEANVILRGVGEQYVTPQVGKRYLLFLSYEPNVFEGYFVQGDMYGFRLVNEDGLLQVPGTDDYVRWNLVARG